MFEDEDDLAENIIYKPCQRCGSTSYDNADCPEPLIDELENKIEFEPTRCDQCDFELLLSDSNLIH